MRSFLLFFFTHLLLINTQAQEKLILDSKGELSQINRNNLKQSRGYQAISAFDTVSRTPLLIYAIYFKNNKMGILNVNSREVTPAIYDEIAGLNISHTTVMFGYHDHYPVVINKKYGLISNTGKVIIPVKYDYITYGAQKVKEKKGLVQDSIFFIKDQRNEYQGDLKGKLVVQKPSEDVTITERVEESYYPSSSNSSSPSSSQQNFSKHGKIIKEYNLLNIVEKKVGTKYLQGAFNKKTNELVIPVEYYYIIQDRYKRLIACRENHCMIKDSTGKDLLNEHFETIEEFNGLYKISKDKKTAFFDKKLQPVSDFVYERFGSANGEIIVVSKNEKFGIVSITGKELTDFIFDEIQIYSSRSMSKTPFVVASIGSKKGLLSPEGNYLTPIQYDDIYPESSVNDHGGGMGDVMPDMYNYDPSNAYFFFKNNNRYGLMDNNFSVITPSEYDQIKKSDNKNFVYVGNQSNNKMNWGILQIKTNRLITPLEFDGNFKYGYNGYFLVSKNYKLGLYKEDGKLIIPVEENGPLYIDYIYKGMIKVYNRKKLFYVDYNDEMIQIQRIEN